MSTVPGTFHMPHSAVDDTAGDDAPTFLLLHGIGLSHREFTGLAKLLSRTGRVVAFDLPGFGRNPRPDRLLSVEEHAALIAERLRRLRREAGLGPVVVVGHSMGAQFAVELARIAPSDVSGLVLIGPVVDVQHPTLVQQAMGLARDWPLEPPATQLMAGFDYLRCGVRWFLAESLAMRDYRIHPRIVGVQHPVLVVRGEHDPIAGRAWCEWLAGRARDGSFAEVAGRRHNLPHSDPAATSAAILAWLARAEPMPVVDEQPVSPPAG
jgi:pimeloyl-ACP methyl ester carboxylesterase